MNTMVRKMDHLNRILLPREMRVAMGIGPNDCLSIMDDGFGTVTIVKGKREGIKRHIDELGRLFLSSSMRDTLNLNKESEVRIICDNNKITLHSAVSVCRICGHELGEGNKQIFQYFVCKNCLNLIQQSSN